MAAADPSGARGRALVDAAATASATLVATVHDVVALDERAWRASLLVERSLSGAHAETTRVDVAWEELVAGRARRFDEGMRIVVALEPLPGWSIWRRRLGERSALGVAHRGEAFLVDPDAPTVEGLARWLAHPADARTEAAALPELTKLAETAAEPIARGALAHIGSVPGLAHALGGSALESLRITLRDPRRGDPLRAELLGLVGRRGLVWLQPDVVALAGSSSALAPQAVAAWSRLPNGIDAVEATALLARPEPGVRAAVLAAAPEALTPEAIEVRLRDDPVAEVRAAAVRALVELRGMSAYEQVAPLLADPNQPEGGAAVRALGELGEPVVPPLVALARAGALDTARGPLLALSLAGPSGTAALASLAAEHEDAAVRALASFLIGRAPETH